MSVSVLNTDSGLSGKTLVNAEDSQTITGLKTFDRDPNAPFVVSAGSAKVDNLDADKLDGQDAPTGDLVGTTDTQILTNKTYFTVVTATDTGSQDDYDPSLGGDTIVRLNNATDLTISGIAAGTDGQRIKLISIGAGNVFLKHQDTGSVAANRLINFATSGDTPLAAGVGTAEYVYDGTTDRWRLVQHEQGDWITPTYASGDFTANGSMTWTVASGDVTTRLYFLRGRVLSLAWTLDRTSVGGTVSTQLKMAIPGGFTAAIALVVPIVLYNNSITTFELAQAFASTDGTVVSFSRSGGGTFTLSSDNTFVYGEMNLQVN